jgi:hypothetical protein
LVLAVPLLPSASERTRIERIMTAAIRDLGLDLSGISVLTEAASGYFSVTPLIAALAGACSVIAVCRDSEFGVAADVVAGTRVWADELGVAAQIEFQNGRPKLDDKSVDIVTNLGFVRPIDDAMIRSLSDHAVICLMWEPWEWRPSDIDIDACGKRGVPVIATRETHPRVRTYDYLAAVAMRLLLENGIELIGARIVVVGSDPFGNAIANGLRAMAATVLLIDPIAEGSPLERRYAELGGAMDAVVFAEHRDPRVVLGGRLGIDPDRLASDGTLAVHICGAIDVGAVRQSGVAIYPAPQAPFGKMTVSTAYAGPTPVVDLHTAGLKVGEIGVRKRRAGFKAEDAVTAAVASGLGLPVGPALRHQQSALRSPSND